jgi:hypothetical protein
MKMLTIYLDTLSQPKDVTLYLDNVRLDTSTKLKK